MERSSVSVLVPPLAPLLLMLSAALVSVPAPLSGDVMPDRSPEDPSPVVHTLRFDDARHHYLEVESRFPAAARDGDSLTVSMAVWTPGSYLVREFARHVEDLEARLPDGTPLMVEKVTKNRWRITDAGTVGAVVTYRLYCREMTVRTNWVDDSFAMLNGAPTFLTAVGEGEDGRPHEVIVEPPSGWTTVVSPLPSVSSDAETSGEHHYRAADFDTLVDSPLYAGSAPVYRFTVDDAEHLLVNEGESGPWDGPRSAEDVEAVVRVQRDFWGRLPYQRYVFFNVISEARGGLEHKDSTVMMTSRWNAGREDDYRDWLGLVSHELFHTWNVKRLRPVALGPFDYETEVYTESLWVAEGVTSYYDDLLLARAGLLTEEQLLKEMSDAAERLQTTPGRRVQSLSESSFDAWIKLYRRDENSNNSSISYYNKGSLVAWLLDMEIRRATDGAASLDTLLRRAWERWSGERGFTREDILSLADEVAGTDLAPFFHRTLDTTEELDYRPALEWLGLRFRPESADGEEDGDDDGPTAWLGAETDIADGLLKVTEVRRGTPAWEAGLQVEDEILALGGFRVPPRELEQRLAAFEPGQATEVLVARREQLVTLPVTLGEKPREDRFRLEPDPDASAAAKARRRAWLGLEEGED